MSGTNTNKLIRNLKNHYSYSTLYL